MQMENQGNQGFIEAIEASPVIGAVKSMDGLDKCLQSDVGVVFILFGDICSIGGITEAVKQAGKLAVVHMDLVNGLAAKEIAVDFIQMHTAADGIITTKAVLIRRAKELGLFTVQRFFAIDSLAYENIPRQLAAGRPDVIEVLPGLMPKVIRRLSQSCHVPIIAGGLIAEKEDVVAMLDAGAIAISSTNEETWFL